MGEGGGGGGRGAFQKVGGSVPTPMLQAYLANLSPPANSKFISTLKIAHLLIPKFFRV